MRNLTGRKIAVLASDGFEKSELFEPLNALKGAGATVEIVSLKPGEIKAWKHDHWDGSIKVDKVVSEVSANDYEGLLIPGGVLNPDKLRDNNAAIDFVKGFFEEQKPVAAICHGPQVLINAEVVEGRRMTSYSSVRKDLENAGADWIDQEVVVDQGLVTSRKPADIPAFNRKMIEEFGEGRHNRKRIKQTNFAHADRVDPWYMVLRH